MGQVIYQSHATSTLLEADKRRIEEEYVYLDIIESFRSEFTANL